MTALEIEHRLIEAVSDIKKGQFESADKLVYDLDHLFTSSANLEKSAIEIKRIETIFELIKAANEVNNLSHALQYLLPLQDQIEDIKQFKLKGFVQEIAGSVYSSLGDYPKAFDYYEAALNSFVEANHSERIGSTKNQIAMLYYNLGEYSLALQYMEQALQTIEKQENHGLTISILGNMANSNLQLRNFEKAETLYSEALKRSDLYDLKKQTAHLTGNMGALFLYKKEYERAMEYYQRAFESYTTLRDELGRSNVMGNMGRLYAGEVFSGYDVVKGEKYLMEAYTICEQIGNKRHAYELAMELSDIYESQQRWQESLNYHKKYHHLKSELASEESIKKAQLLENNRKVAEAERDRQVKLARFQEQEKILHNILPAQIAERILKGEKQIADTCEKVSVFFCDIVGFTKLSEHISAHDLVNILNEIFSEFDQIAKEYNLEKIKTIGDAYMAVAGVPKPDTNHAEHAALFALKVMNFLNNYASKTGRVLEIRVGLHCGHAVAGIIGESKFAYDLWGDAVNTASRMESHGLPGRIQVSEDFKNALTNSNFFFEERGELEIKGKGIMKTYFLNGI